MFRRLSSSLPKDPVFPADLEGLGYVQIENTSKDTNLTHSYSVVKRDQVGYWLMIFSNGRYYLNEQDQIRSIGNPDQEFNYFISKNERVCEVQREAMSGNAPFHPYLPSFELTHLLFSAVIRNILKPRFLATLNLTLLPLTASETDPHVPIYTSRNLSAASRTILYFGEDVQDLGVFALRTIGQVSVASGSALDFVSAVQSSRNPPGLIIANMGQLLWYRRGGYPVTRVTWGALPRKTGISLQMVVNQKNRIPGNEDMAAHVKYIFEEVVPKMVNPTAGLDVIGVGEGGTEVMEYLQSAWGKWKGRVQAIAIGSGYHWPATQAKDSDFIDFWGKVGLSFPQIFAICACPP